jgi:hypothetical protein
MAITLDKNADSFLFMGVFDPAELQVQLNYFS